jgi:neutral ceramidase
MAESLMAGFGSADITPPPGIAHGGWGAQLHQRSQGNDLSLQARALVLRSEPPEVAIVDLDAIGFDAQITHTIIAAISELTGIPCDRIRVSCTHTHSGPNTFRLGMIKEGLDMVRTYLQSLPHRVAGAVWQARQNMEPVQIGAAKGSCDININRRCRDKEGRTFVGCNETPPADRTVTVVRFDRAGKVPLAAIMHYSCHATTMGWQNQFVTPDYPGRAKQVVEESLGAPCLFLQGCAGDLGPRRGFTGDLSVYHKLGTILGLEAAKLAWNIETQPAHLELQHIQESGARIGIYKEIPCPPQAVALRVIQAQVPMPVRPHPDPVVMRERAKELRARIDDLRLQQDEDALRTATALATQAGMAAERAELYYGKSTIPWPVQAIAIGDVALLSMAGEPFSAIGLHVKERSPFPYTVVSGYSNGGFGYIPTREAFPEGGYEVETTPFAENAAEVITDASVDLLNGLWQQAH